MGAPAAVAVFAQWQVPQSVEALRAALPAQDETPHCGNGEEEPSQVASEGCKEARAGCARGSKCNAGQEGSEEQGFRSDAMGDAEEK